ncbi:MAG: hypothetical protein M3546_08660 [Actinomycetota bacterium]|nr:hypothetical protein [Actinomycetota bacterium]
MPSRSLAAVFAGSLLALFAAGSASTHSSAAATATAMLARSFEGPAETARFDRSARSALTWRGGPVTASTGEVVEVYVSDALPAETPEKWAEFLVQLTHGPELDRLTSNIASLDEVQDLCGARALGCYSGNEMVSLGEPAPDGTTPEEVVRHEYGHHVAWHRLNTPWRAVDWGPKHWASAATVCPRVTRREAFPGNEGSNYAQNPGEAWAEAYRLMDERKAGITTASWPIIASSFFPDEAGLLAAERDVLQPWTVNQKSVFRRSFAKGAKKVWWIALPTPLDGELVLSATLPRAGLHDVSLVAANRSTVVKRAQWVSQRVKRLASGVCGQRSLFVRVTPSGAAGQVTVTVSKP